MLKGCYERMGISERNHLRHSFLWKLQWVIKLLAQFQEQNSTMPEYIQGGIFK